MKRRVLSFALALVLLLTLAPAVSAAYTEMSFSDACVSYIKTNEGFRAEAYNDGTGWYIGYGTACGRDEYPEGITEEQAEALLRDKMALFAAEVNRFLKTHDVAVSQGQFDALCAMCYALGTAWLDPANRLPSYLINGVENYSDEEVCSAFAAWCHVNGVAVEGLIRRRIIEAKMFLYEEYSDTASDWNWLILDPAGGELEHSDVVCYKYGTLYGSFPQPTREGCTFTGWYTAEGTRLSETAPSTGNLKVTAGWREGTDGGETQPPEEPGVFPDVPEGIWYHDYVERLCSEGVVEGFDDGYFYPEESVTWGQALKLVLLAAGYPAQNREENGHWASGYLSYAEKKEFVAAGSVTDLDAPVTRDQIADLAAAALELSRPAGMASPYADSDRDSVLALYAQGIMEGSEENGSRLFKGGDPIKRSEICAVLCRVSDYVEANLILFAGYRIPIDETLERCEYDRSLFRTEDGRVYYDDERFTVRYGIDVSYYQGDIDWEKVAADGIDFAIIRVGYRGASTGDLFTDVQFENNMRGALAAGLDVGVYFFSQAITVEEALEEFDYMMERISGYDITFPVVYDWEPLNSTGSRTRYYDPAMVDQCTVAFCDAVAQAGYTPMTYYNPAMAYLKHDMRLLDGYAGWLANYASVPNYIYDYQMWQYTSSGSVNGINGRVDMNIAFVDFAAEGTE